MEDGRYLDLDNEVAGILMSTEPHQNQQMVNVKNVSESCTIQQVHTDPTVVTINLQQNYFNLSLTQWDPLRIVKFNSILLDF